MSDDSSVEKENSVEQQSEGDKLSIPALKYFWQASPLSGTNQDSIPKFLRGLKVFQHFSDYELKVFSEFIHQRNYSAEEMIIKEGETGFGFYLILVGQVEIFTQRNRIIDDITEVYQQFVTRLSKSDYFGELALLEQQNKRNASAISKGSTKLLAIYRPDLEEMIERYPVVGAKFLQSVSLIMAMRFHKVTDELRQTKEQLSDLERKIDSQ